MTINTDFRALCAELLLFAVEAGEIAENEGLWPDCDPDCALIDRARAALAEGDGPAVPEGREPASVTGEATPAPFRNFDGMCWPVPCERLGTLEHCLRYGHENTHFSMKDRLLAASVIAAYVDLIQKPNIRRNAICKELRKGPGSADG
jgi:hypothetical protein